mmetsp:Transcript_259/g.442  ORF Transcript_259/g.442 Transcript_259/m.442 type:complete len:91 (+) Transcript_259:748-1020(+)
MTLFKTLRNGVGRNTTITAARTRAVDSKTRIVNAKHKFKISGSESMTSHLRKKKKEKEKGKKRKRNNQVTTTKKGRKKQEKFNIQNKIET